MQVGAEEGGHHAVLRPMRGAFVGERFSPVASKSQSGCSGEVQERRANLHHHYLGVVLGAGTKLVSR